MEFTIVDGGVAVVTLVSGLLAYSRGVTREIFAIGGWILAALAAFYLAPVLEPFTRELPVVGDFLEGSCIISMIASFTIVVAFALLVLSVFTPLASSAILESPLAPIDRVLGFVFGIARGLVLIGIGYLLYQSLSSAAWPPIENAASKTLFEETARMLQEIVPQSIPDWFGARIDALMDPCSGEGLGTSPTTGDGAASGPQPSTPTGQVAPQGNAN